jgi:hypothetical protein
MTIAKKHKPPGYPGLEPEYALARFLDSQEEKNWFLSHSDYAILINTELQHRSLTFGNEEIDYNQSQEEVNNNPRFPKNERITYEQNRILLNKIHKKDKNRS